MTAGVTMGEGMTDVENRFSHWSQNVSWMRHFGLNFEVNQLKVDFKCQCFSIVFVGAFNTRTARDLLFSL